MTTARTAIYRAIWSGHDLRVVFREFPVGLERFGVLHRGEAVSVRCPADGSGIDVTPLLVAADWIREQGWAIRQDVAWAAGKVIDDMPHDEAAG